MPYKVGTMIEIPRAALTADEIAKDAAFFSFGTNDLTQMTFGFSRDDAGKFLASYYDRKIYESDPFSKLDQAGVGRLVKMAAELGRKTRPDIKLGICGEQGGDPQHRRLLPQDRPDLRLLQPLPCPHRKTCRRASRPAGSGINQKIAIRPACADAQAGRRLIFSYKSLTRRARMALSTARIITPTSAKMAAHMFVPYRRPSGQGRQISR